jgi:acyl-coenzyme A thioesterase PaaI-like protein
LKIKNLGIDEGLFNRISEVAQHMPFYNLLGIRITALGPGYAELMVSTGADHANNLDIVHGGLLVTRISTSCLMYSYGTEYLFLSTCMR